MKKLLLLLAITCSLESNAAAQTLFYFTSSPTSWVGHGQTLTMGAADGYTIDVNLYGNTLEADVSNPNGDWWRVDFSAQNGVPFSTGTFAGAQRFAGAAYPGLDFVGEARGDDAVAGSFQVLDFTEQDGVVTSAAVDFTQYDETNPAWWNVGSLRYNSAIAAVPEPSCVSLIFAGGAIASRIWKRGLKARSSGRL